MNIPRARAKRFLSLVIGSVVVTALTTILINAYVDPLWMFPEFGNRPGLQYCVADERQNKTNKMIFGGAAADSVIIGSSRSEVFDSRFFKNDRVVNIAVNGARPIELAAYLDIYVRHVGMPKNVYVGLDFFGYLYEGDERASLSAPMKEKAALDPAYRINGLLDLGLLKKSIDTIKTCSTGKYTAGPLHTYDGVEPTNNPSPVQHQIVESQLEFFRTLYDRKKPTDPQFRAHLKAIKAAAPGATIHAFTPPVRAELYNVLVTARGAQDYDDWLAAIVDEFGSAVHFGGINSFTTNNSHFYDTNHVYTRFTEKMASILEGRTAPDPDGFGRRVLSTQGE